MSRVNTSNEWSQLEEAVLGITPPNFSIRLVPAGEHFSRHPLRYTRHVVREARRVLAWMSRRPGAEHALASLERLLRDHGIIVHRPASLPRQPDGHFKLPQMFPRDPLFVVGHTIILGRLKSGKRWMEIMGLGALIEKLRRDGGRVVSVPEDEGIFLEGGDVLVDLPYLYVGIGGQGSNAKGAEWLQREFGSDLRVVPVPLANPRIIHLDCCLALIGPGLGMLHRPSLVSPLPSPLRQYEFIEVDAPVRELWTNVLMLGPQIALVQSRHLALQAALRARGFRVICLDVRWQVKYGGAFRCAVTPLRRQAEPGSGLLTSSPFAGRQPTAPE